MRLTSLKHFRRLARLADDPKNTIDTTGWTNEEFLTFLRGTDEEDTQLVKSRISDP